MKRRGNKRNKIEELPQFTFTGVVCGVISIIIFIVLSIISTVNKGSAGLWIGIIGMLAFFINIFGMYMTVRGIKENENMFFTLPLIGMVFNGIMLLVYLILYVVGIF